MASGSRRGVAALLTLALLGACSGPGTGGGVEEAPSTTTAAVPATTTTTLPPTTTLAPTTTTSAPTTSSSFDTGVIDADIRVPDGDGPFPAVVLVHGGAWVAGDPSIMTSLARHLTDNGFLTVNTRYQLSSVDHSGFPEAIEDVACAVRLAASHPDADGTVAVVGHSAGAHIGAVVALTGDQYTGDCPIAGSGLPERFVGLAGPYDVSRLLLGMTVFFGGTAEDHPDEWMAGNPQLLTDENPDLAALIMYGEFDGLVDDSFAFRFADALDESGADVLLELVEGATHNEMHDPDLVGDLIATWLDRPTSA